MGNHQHIATNRQRVQGFTLLELLVTIAVAAILLAIAIPSYRSVVQRNAMAATVNDLVGALNYARSQSVTRGTPVFICKSEDQANCTEGGGWEQGWLIFAPLPGAAAEPSRDNILRVRSPLEGQISISGNRNISSRVAFDANGFAMGSIGTFTATAQTSDEDTLVVLAGTGQITTLKQAGDDS